MGNLKTIKMTCKKCGMIIIAETLSRNPPKEEMFECNNCVWEKWQKEWNLKKKSQLQLAL